MSLFHAIILAIIEGLTEFLPISSTGHEILATTILGINHDDFAKMYIIVIQLGAILSVVVLYWRKFFSFGNFKNTFDFYLKLLVAFLPAVVFGVLLNDVIHQLLSDVEVVGVTLLLGGVFLLFVDIIFKENENMPEIPVTFPIALKIGLFQVIAMLPGVSRSASTIVGGLTQKMNRKQAAEFSFFLAVPTMFAATAKDLYDNQQLLHSGNISTLIIGCAIAFIVAMIAIKSFIGFLTKHGFKVFGYYRIALGIIILLIMEFGKGFQIF
jgi:undecaprenyl-diphosphatase